MSTFNTKHTICKYAIPKTSILDLDKMISKLKPESIKRVINVNLINGISKKYEDEVIVVINETGSFLNILNRSPKAAKEQQIVFSNNKDISLANGESISIQFDSVLGSFRVVALNDHMHACLSTCNCEWADKSHKQNSLILFRKNAVLFHKPSRTKWVYESVDPNTTNHVLRSLNDKENTIQATTNELNSFEEIYF